MKKTGGVHVMMEKSMVVKTKIIKRERSEKEGKKGLRFNLEEILCVLFTEQTSIFKLQ